MTILLVVLLATLAMPASAEALELPTDRPLANRGATDSLKVAASFWGAQVKCPAGVRVYVAPLDMLDSADGSRTAAGAAQDCGIWLDPDTLHNLFDAPWDYQDRISRCDIIVHEYGHLLNGPGHSTNPLSIMAPERNIEVDVMGCYQRFKPARVTRAQDREAFGTRRLWAVR